MAGNRESEWLGLLSSLGQFNLPCDGPEAGEIDAILKSLVQGSMDIENRRSVVSDHISWLQRLFEFLCGRYPPAPPTSREAPPPSPDALTSLLKLMRNLCAGVPENQKLLLASDVPTLSARLVLRLASPLTPSHTHTAIVKTALQLLGNLCVQRAEGQRMVWQLCFPEAFRAVTGCSNTELADISCMVIHTCTLSQQEHRTQLCSKGGGGDDIIAHVLGCLATTDQSEWITILLDSLLTSTSLQQLLECLELRPQAVVALLGYITTTREGPDHGNAEEESETGPEQGVLREENLLFLVEEFQRVSQHLLLGDASLLREASGSTCESPAVAMVKIAMATLRVLCRFMEWERWLLTVQGKSPVLEAAIALLRQLAVLDGSAASGRHRSQLRHVRPTGSEQLHPLFGAKRDLLQFVSSLCYRNATTQTQVRELEAIPLILNQCSIDHHNPYITQWAVLAIRNLCEGNPANQALIASLERRGVADTKALLEFGCEVEIDDQGKIKVKQKPK